MRRWRRSVVVAGAILLGVPGCSREPDSLPDIAADMSTIHTILTNHVAESGGSADSFGPYRSQGLDLDMFASCLGGGRMTLTAFDSQGRRKASIFGDCHGTRIGGGQFHSGENQPDAYCVVPTFEGKVTAWEVVISEARLDTMAPQVAARPRQTATPTDDPSHRC